MNSPLSLLRCFGLSALVCLAVSESDAQNTTWGNAGASWGSAANWTTGVPDSNIERAIFTTAGSPVNPDVDGTYTIQGITFSNSLTTSYTFGGVGELIIDANSTATTNTIQVNGNQTFNVNLSTTNSADTDGQRFVIGTGSGTMNFGAGYTFSVGTGGVSLQATGAGSGEFNFSGTVNLGSNPLTQQSTATSVYFREGSSISSSATSGIISNSAGNMYFETDDIDLGGSANITMFGSLAFDAAIYLTRDGLNVTENIRVANTASGFTRTVGVDIAGSGTATWSGDVNISQNTSGGDIDRTVALTAGAGDRAVFSGNIISTSATVFTDTLEIGGGGTVVLSGAGNTYTAATEVIAGTTFLANNAAGSATGGNAVTVNGTLGGTGSMSMTGASGLTVNSGGVVAPGDGGIESLEINLAGTTGSASFLSGSSFVFDLSTPGTSDVLDFTGLTASSGDVIFNGNVINFNDLGSLAPGLYTLMTFDADNAYTGTLAVGSGLGGYTGSFIYNADSIQLNVVPEPSVAVLLLGGFAGMACLRLRRRN
jgi:fibronectin-binding autotransporter adhesin